MGYLSDVYKGVSWMGAFRVLTRSLTFLRIIILARILTPGQFGVFGIVSIILSLTELITETGVNVFLIQERQNIKTYIHTAWIVSIVRGIIICCIMLLSAPFVSAYFNSPESFSLLMLASIIPLLRGFINPAIISFQKDLEFNKEFFLRATTFIIETCVVIILAFLTKSTASFIWGMIVSVIVEILLSFVFIKIRPKLAFDLQQFKYIIFKGKYVTLNGIFTYLFHNIDNIVVGKMLGVGALGVYDVAYRISIIPITEATEVVAKVTFPVYAKISEDINRLKKAYFKTLLVIILLIIPFGLLLALFPRFFVETFLGPQWENAISILPILAIFGVLKAIAGTTSTIFYSLKEQKIAAIISFISLIILTIIIVPFVELYGIRGAATAALIATIIILPFSFIMVLRLFK